ncbi:MAG: hypothetical protein ACK6DP_06120 [Gemmatimonas sp.]|jgi:hypothetical protein|uniref:hypothetical protein n=1 Tax=Gemmatimonas sp. TaxID=1962908 RepID=UPI00391F2341|nr:hypothetical protein [Gemmatimonadota bacterium]
MAPRSHFFDMFDLMCFRRPPAPRSLLLLLPGLAGCGRRLESLAGGARSAMRLR